MLCYFWSVFHLISWYYIWEGIAANLIQIHNFILRLNKYCLWWIFKFFLYFTDHSLSAEHSHLPDHSSFWGFTERPWNPWRPVGLGPGSQGDLMELSRGWGLIYWERCYKVPWGSLISPRPGGTRWLQQPYSIKTACLHNVLSVQFMAWLLPTVHFLQVGYE